VNRLKTVKPVGSSVPIATYDYDGVGNRESVTHDNGIVTSYAYNRRNRLTGIQHKLGATLLLGVAYTLDASGLRTGITETGQINRSVAYSYDGVKRLTSETVTQLGNDRTTNWTYDRTGNRLTQTKSLGPVGSPTGTASTTYVYDANDRLETESLTLSGTVPGAVAGTTAYTHDAAGNTTKKVSPTETIDYVYDDANRLAELQTLAGDVTRYAYAHDGIRLSQTRDATGANPVTTHYLIDPNTAYAQVIEEAEQVGSGALSVKALYAVGDDRIRRYTPAVAGSGGNPGVPAGLRYYHADGLGSTRLLSDETGSVTDRTTFEAFGEIDAAASQQTTANTFLYTGEQMDPNSGFVYLRARYMDPRAGRFTTMDSWLGKDFDPLSLHKYTYANGSPSNYIDPTGHYTADFGRAVEDEVCDQYKSVFMTGPATECGDVTFYSFERYFKPDIMDWGVFTFNEVKPLSPSGIAKGITQIALYSQAYSQWNFTPNVTWIPDSTVVDDREVHFLNLSGVIFYTDDRQLKREMAAVTLATAAVLLKRRAAIVATRLGADAAAQALITRAISSVPMLNAARLHIATMVAPFLR